LAQQEVRANAIAAIGRVRQPVGQEEDVHAEYRPSSTRCDGGENTDDSIRARFRSPYGSAAVWPKLPTISAKD
jgi:hypothetical protein